MAIGKCKKVVLKDKLLKLYMPWHIFLKAQVAVHKNAHNFRHHFWAQFFMLFCMVWSILFGVLGQETTFSLVEILEQPIRNFHFKVFKANTPNKMDHTMWKSMKNCARKWCRRLCAFLLAATWAFGKMWHRSSCVNLTMWLYRWNEISLDSPRCPLCCGQAVTWGVRKGYHDGTVALT